MLTSHRNVIFFKSRDKKFLGNLFFFNKCWKYVGKCFNKFKQVFTFGGRGGSDIILRRSP